MMASSAAASVLASAVLVDVHGAMVPVTVGCAVVAAGLASWFSAAPYIKFLDVNLDDSGCRRGPLLIVLCRFSAVVAGWRVAVLPDVLGVAPAPTAPGRPPFRVAGTGWAGQVGAGRVHSRRQQVRNASFQGQVRLILSMRARAWRTSRAGSAHNR